MHQTFSMLGKEREAEFAREAERRRLAASVAARPRRLSPSVRLHAPRFAARLLAAATTLGKTHFRF